MKYRDYMKNNNTNLTWCKPLRGENLDLVLCNGKIAALRIDGAEIPPTPAALRDAAQRVNPYFRDYVGYNDSHIIIDAAPEEMPCRCCPWFTECDAMDSEIEE